MIDINNMNIDQIMADKTRNLEDLGASTIMGLLPSPKEDVDEDREPSPILGIQDLRKKRPDASDGKQTGQDYRQEGTLVQSTSLLEYVGVSSVSNLLN